MPALRMTEQQRREKALLRAIARAKVDMDLPRDGDVALALCISPSTYSNHKSNPYVGFGFDRVARLVRALQFTGEELCEIFGVPYAPQKGGNESGC